MESSIPMAKSDYGKPKKREAQFRPIILRSMSVKHELWCEDGGGSLTFSN